MLYMDRKAGHFILPLKLPFHSFLVGRYRFIATPLTATYTSVAIITTYSDQFGVAIDWLWYSDLFGIVSVVNCIDSLACIGYM